MMDLSAALTRRHPLVVGSVGTRELLHGSIPASECDLVELRLDLLGCGAEVQEFAARQREIHPLLVTVRHPDEGGAGALTPPQRAAAYDNLFPYASLIDVELQFLGDLAEPWADAARRGILRVASWHRFDSCPELPDLRSRLADMHAAGADLAKFAFMLGGARDLQVIGDLLGGESPLPLSVMGMGRLAPASRLLASQLGSVLNYGYLGPSATAPGQWPARLLKEAVAASAKGSEAVS